MQGQEGVQYVCTYTQRQEWRPHTHADTIQKSQITHEILMVLREQQKLRWGRQEQQEWTTEKWGIKKVTCGH